MTENEFLHTLEQALSGLEPSARAEVLADYREHFASAREAGRSDDETSRKLGDPRTLARGYAATEKLAQAERASSIAGRSWHLLGVAKALIILAPLNFLMAIGPFLILAAALLVGWIAAGGLFMLSCKLLAHWLGLQPIANLEATTNWSVFFLTVSGLSFGLLSMLGMGLLVAASLRGLLRSFKWNLRFVNKEGRISHV
jgi:uncharacterized membrane protein